MRSKPSSPVERAQRLAEHPAEQARVLLEREVLVVALRRRHRRGIRGRSYNAASIGERPALRVPARSAWPLSEGSPRSLAASAGNDTDDRRSRCARAPARRRGPAPAVRHRPRARSSPRTRLGRLEARFQQGAPRWCGARGAGRARRSRWSCHAGSTRSSPASASTCPRARPALHTALRQQDDTPVRVERRGRDARRSARRAPAHARRSRGGCATASGAARPGGRSAAW